MSGVAHGGRAPPAWVTSEGALERSWYITAFPRRGTVQRCLGASEWASAQSFAKPGDLIVRKDSKEYKTREVNRPSPS